MKSNRPAEGLRQPREASWHTRRFGAEEDPARARRRIAQALLTVREYSGLDRSTTKAAGEENPPASAAHGACDRDAARSSREAEEAHEGSPSKRARTGQLRCRGQPIVGRRVKRDRTDAKGATSKAHRVEVQQERAEANGHDEGAADEEDGEKGTHGTQMPTERTRPEDQLGQQVGTDRAHRAGEECAAEGRAKSRGAERGMRSVSARHDCFESFEGHEKVTRGSEAGHIVGAIRQAHGERPVRTDYGRSPRPGRTKRARAEGGNVDLGEVQKSDGQEDKGGEASESVKESSDRHGGELQEGLHGACTAG